MSLDRHIGTKLRDLREERAVTPEKVAAYLSISLERYSAFELGREAISARHLYDICRLFDKPVTYFFEEYEDVANKDDRDNGDLNPCNGNGQNK